MCCNGPKLEFKLIQSLSSDAIVLYVDHLQAAHFEVIFCMYSVEKLEKIQRADKSHQKISVFIFPHLLIFVYPRVQLASSSISSWCHSAITLAIVADVLDMNGLTD